jgi:TonB family protein
VLAACERDPCDDPLAAMVCEPGECPGLEAPRKVQNSEPHYPDEARRLGIQGIVVLDALIDCRGAVTDVRVVASPDQLLTDAAVAAVRGWKYEPARYRDSVVSMRLRVTLNFRLSRDAGLKRQALPAA